MDTSVERTMWCPKRCDLLNVETKPNPYEFKFTLNGSLFYLLALISGYIAVSKPSVVFDNLPLEMPTMLFFVVAMVSSLIGRRFSQGIISDYSCPSCKGILLEYKPILENPKSLKTRKERKNLIKFLEILGESNLKSNLQCPSCTKEMYTMSVFYEDNSRMRLDPDSVGIALMLAHTALEVVTGPKRIDLDGCKDCLLLWFDNLEKDRLGGSTILSEKESLE